MTFFLFLFASFRVFFFGEQLILFFAHKQWSRAKLSFNSTETNVLNWKLDEKNKLAKKQIQRTGHTHTYTHNKNEISRKSCDQAKRKNRKAKFELFKSTLSTRLLATWENESIDRTNGVCKIRSTETLLSTTSIGVSVWHLCMCVCARCGIFASVEMYVVQLLTTLNRYDWRRKQQNQVGVWIDSEEHWIQNKTKQNTLKWAV